MRIALIGQKGVPTAYGGIERHAEELAIELVKQGHDVLAYARSWYAPKKIKKYKGIKIIFTPTIRTKHLDAITHTFFSVIHALFQKPDIIHFHGVGPSLLSWIPRLFSPKTKVIATFHCVDRYHQKWNRFARFFLKLGEKAACVFPHETIAVSKTIQNYCLNEYQKKTFFIQNGVRQPEKTGSATIKNFELKPNKYILMVSRLVRHKGVHYLLEAWKILEQKYPELIKNYKLVIVGGSVSTDDYVRELNALSGNDESIIFTDWQKGEKLEELYANCAFLVHPSENEGLPITVLQAMAHGKAVLVSDIPEHMEIISDDKFLFANANARSLAKKIASLLKNKKIREKAEKENKRLTEQKYDWEKITEDTLEIYELPYNEQKIILEAVAKTL